MNSKFKRIVLVSVLTVLMVMTLVACGGGGVDFDERISLIGQCKSEVLEVYDDLKYSYDYSGGYFYETEANKDLLVGFSAMSIINNAASQYDFIEKESTGGVICNSLWGTTAYMLGIEETTPIADIEAQLGVDFGTIQDVMEVYDDPELGDGYADYTDKDGNSYKLIINTNINGNVEPTDTLLVILN